MKQEHVTDSIPAYALGILEADEQAEVAAHLDGCPDCQATLAAYEAIAAELAMAAPQHAPPAYLKARLRERLVANAPHHTGPAAPQHAPPAAAPRSGHRAPCAACDLPAAPGAGPATT